MNVKPKISFPGKISPTRVKVETAGKRNSISQRNLSSSLTIECYNYTGQVIKTLDHLGLCTIHEPVSTSPEDSKFIGSFVMKRIYTVSENTQVTEMYSAVEGAGRYDEFDLDLANDIVVGINHRQREELRQRLSIMFFAVEHKTISENNGSVYVRDVDLVIMNSSHALNITHPNSPKGMDYVIDQLYETAHTYSVEINDPLNPESKFYMNINNRIFVITPTRNTHIGEEVRIIFKQPNQQAETIHLGKIDDVALAEVGVFRNYQDADNYGKRLEILKAQTELATANSKLTVEEKKVESFEKQAEIKLDAEQRLIELKFKEHELKQIEREEQHKKELIDLRNAMEQARRDQVIEAEKYERTLSKLRNEDYYENRSYNRKDSNEALKSLPLILGAGMALFAILK